MKNVLTKDKLLELKYTNTELENYLSFLKDVGFVKEFKIIYRPCMDVYWIIVDGYEGYIYNKNNIRKTLIEFFKMVKFMKKSNELMLKEVGK